MCRVVVVVGRSGRESVEVPSKLQQLLKSAVPWLGTVQPAQPFLGGSEVILFGDRMATWLPKASYQYWVGICPVAVASEVPQFMYRLICEMFPKPRLLVWPMKLAAPS